MVSATLSSKFQIVIPKQVREEMGLRPGQRLVFVPEGKVLHLVVPMDLEEFLGCAAGAEPGGYRDKTDRIHAGPDR
jgi:AbrB family looped-hinge helix DNA binding protein